MPRHTGAYPGAAPAESSGWTCQGFSLHRYHDQGDWWVIQSRFAGTYWEQNSRVCMENDYRECNTREAECWTDVLVQFTISVHGKPQGGSKQLIQLKVIQICNPDDKWKLTVFGITSFVISKRKGRLNIQWTKLQHVPLLRLIAPWRRYGHTGVWGPIDMWISQKIKYYFLQRIDSWVPINFHQNTLRHLLMDLEVNEFVDGSVDCRWALFIVLNFCMVFMHEPAWLVNSVISVHANVIVNRHPFFFSS